VRDAHRLALKDASVDLVVSKETLEQFVEPSVIMKEVYRVLKEGRTIYHLDAIYAPFLWRSFLLL
jgi:ubiquinone/menaquinone biosynthesis C-methylase UbiE